MAQIIYGLLDFSADEDPPEIVNEVPAPGSSGILVYSDVDFDVKDVRSDVDLAATIVNVNSGSGYVEAYSAGSFQNGFAGTVTSGISETGVVFYGFEITPPNNFPYQSDIYVKVFAKDIENNSGETIYNFLTQQTPDTSRVYKFPSGDAPVREIRKELPSAKEILNIFVRTKRDMADITLRVGEEADRIFVKRQTADWIEKKAGIPFTIEDRIYIPVELMALDIGKGREFLQRKHKAVVEGSKQLLKYYGKESDINLTFEQFRYEDYYLDPLPGARLRFLVSIQKTNLNLFSDREKKEITKTVKLNWGKFVRRSREISRKIDEIVKD